MADKMQNWHEDSSAQSFPSAFCISCRCFLLLCLALVSPSPFRPFIFAAQYFGSKFPPVTQGDSHSHFHSISHSYPSTAFDFLFACHSMSSSQCSSKTRNHRHPLSIVLYLSDVFIHGGRDIYFAEVRLCFGLFSSSPVILNCSFLYTH